MHFQRPHHTKHSTRVKGCRNSLVHPSTATPRRLMTLRIAPLSVLRYGHSLLAHANHDHQYLASSNRATQGTDIFYPPSDRSPPPGSMNFCLFSLVTLHLSGWRSLITTLCFHHTYALFTADVLLILFHVLAMARLFSGPLNFLRYGDFSKWVMGFCHSVSLDHVCYLDSLVLMPSCVESPR